MSKKRKGKWLPFDALEGFKDKIHEINERSERVKKPVLDEQQLELINENVRIALEEKMEIEIVYFENGHFKNFKGVITKFDALRQTISLGTKKISAEDILEIHKF
ncbi:MAG: YolD-like family protein [Erysipelotrichales bacterium]|nr:YolD-like family protein [Erysipelotrichales bacterium]